MAGCEIVSTTPNGNPANVNTRIGVGSQRAYLTYRRASETSPHNSLAVIDICVIFTNKVRRNVEMFHLFFLKLSWHCVAMLILWRDLT